METFFQRGQRKRCFPLGVNGRMTTSSEGFTRIRMNSLRGLFWYVYVLYVYIRVWILIGSPAVNP